MSSPKITLIGAGGMSFGPSMVNDVIHTKSLRGSRLVLHDIDETRLERAYRLAARLNSSSGAPVIIDKSSDPGYALDGADFCISSAEHGRFRYWRQDYEIPNRHGARQITGENGGPGAVFHSLRSIENTLGICRDIERYSPDAFLVNLSNPMSRVTLAIARGTRLRHVGMCHEAPIGVVRLAKMMRRSARNISAKASGINHFTFFTEMTDNRTGEDLLPQVREMFSRPAFDYPPRSVALVKAAMRYTIPSMLADQLYMPLVTHMVREFGLVPCSVDSHIGEYLPFALGVAGYHPVPVDIFERIDLKSERLADWASRTRLPLPLHRVGHSLEEVVPIIAAIWTGVPRRVMAVNVANHGYLPDVEDGAIVEVGATVDSSGIHPDVMDPIGEPLRGFISKQVQLQSLVVDSALTGDPEPALQAVLQDPCSPEDEAACRAIFEELRALQSDELPFS